MNQPYAIDSRLNRDTISAHGSALIGASRAGNEDIVRLLLGTGMSPDDCNDIGETAIQVAAAEGHEKIVQVLIDIGANFHAKPWTYSRSLEAAATNGHTGVVRLFLDRETAVPEALPEKSPKQRAHNDPDDHSKVSNDSGNSTISEAVVDDAPQTNAGLSDLSHTRSPLVATQVNTPDLATEVETRQLDIPDTFEGLSSIQTVGIVQQHSNGSERPDYRQKKKCPCSPWIINSGHDHSPEMQERMGLHEDTYASRKATLQAVNKSFDNKLYNDDEIEAELNEDISYQLQMPEAMGSPMLLDYLPDDLGMENNNREEHDMPFASGFVTPPFSPQGQDAASTLLRLKAVESLENPAPKVTDLEPRLPLSNDFKCDHPGCTVAPFQTQHMLK